MPTPSPLVTLRDVSFSYGPTPALEAIHLDIETDVTVGLIGPNGGGKTTLLKLLLGELLPNRGSVQVAGLSPRKAVARGDVIGYLPQHGHDVTRLPITVRDAVRLGLAGKAGFLRSPARSDLDFADSLLERVGLKGREDVPLRSLSGGQLQRAYIARALAPRPRLLLLDEPTTGIDRGSQERLVDLIGELRRELKLTVLIVSHDLRAVTSIADRIACLDRTLHYHDVPHNFPEEMARGLFCCDLEAMGLGHGHGDASHACAHDHPATLPNVHDATHAHVTVAGRHPDASAARAHDDPTDRRSAAGIAGVVK